MVESASGLAIIKLSAAKVEVRWARTLPIAPVAWMRAGRGGGGGVLARVKRRISNSLLPS